MAENKIERSSGAAEPTQETRSAGFKYNTTTKALSVNDNGTGYEVGVGGGVQFAEVTVSTAQVLDLADTAVTLVAAPGAGKMLVFHQAVLILDYNSIGYTESSDNLAVYYDTESGAQASEVIECTGFIDQTADTITFAVPNGGAATVLAAATGLANKALVLANPNDDFAAGNSPVRVKVWYSTIETGL